MPTGGADKVPHMQTSHSEKICSHTSSVRTHSSHMVLFALISAVGLIEQQLATIVGRSFRKWQISSVVEELRRQQVQLGVLRRQLATFRRNSFSLKSAVSLRSLRCQEMALLIDDLLDDLATSVAYETDSEDEWISVRQTM